MSDSDTRLSNRVAIVTGAASGIGRASAQLFARHGANVLAVDVPGSDVKGTAATDAACAGRIVTLEQSVAEDEAPKAIVDACLSQFGQLDILMNNAGVSGSILVQDHSDADWDRINAVNVRAPFRLCREVIPHLVRSAAGRIINVASVMAEGTDYGLAAYCASKSGVAGLTRTLALELGKHGITANYIEPGAIYTGMTKTNFDKQDIAQIWAKKSALRRLGQPIDIARGALFLASDDGAFVTGHGLRVDGGLMLRV